MKDTVNVAIVGFGNIAKSHYLGVINANLKLNLPFHLKVSHIISSKGDEIAPDNEDVFENLKKAYESDTKFDFIDICNINEAHLKEIEQAEALGKSIYCEKPLTSNLADSKKACDLVKRKKLRNGTPLIFRYIPAIHLLKDAVVSKTLGDVIEFKATFYHDSYLNAERRSSWRTKKSSGGGSGIDLSIHLLDTVRFIFGDVKKTSTEMKIFFKSDVDNDEVSTTKVLFKNNICGEIETSRIYNQFKKKCEIEVFCTNGSFMCNILKPYILQINYFKGDTIIKKAKDEKIMKYVVSEDSALNYHQDAHTAAIADMARKVYNGSDSGFLATFEDAMIAQELLGTIE